MRSSDDLRRRVRATGFTLVELLVVVTLSSIIMTLAIRAWQPMSAETLSLRDRARAAGELRLAVDALLSDLGGAETVTESVAGDELYITREQAVAERLGAWSGGDLGILYSLVSGDLVRNDLALGITVTIATDLGAIEVDESGGETSLRLETGADLTYREVTLRWAP